MASYQSDFCLAVSHETVQEGYAEAFAPPRSTIQRYQNLKRFSNHTIRCAARVICQPPDFLAVVTRSCAKGTAVSALCTAEKASPIY